MKKETLEKGNQLVKFIGLLKWELSRAEKEEWYIPSYLLSPKFDMSELRFSHKKRVIEAYLGKIREIEIELEAL